MRPRRPERSAPAKEKQMVTNCLMSRLSLLGLMILAVLLVPRPSPAHPMGNFSISHYAGIRIEQDFIELRYLIDMAEIPTFQEIQHTGIVPKASDPSLSGYLARKVDVLKQGLLLEVNGQLLHLRVVAQEVIFPPGAGGLPTMKIGLLFRATLEDLTSASLYYRDSNFPDRAGWKEIVAVGGQGITFVSSSVPGRDRSFQLANYPTDLLNSPPQDLEARVTFRGSGVRDSELRPKSKIPNPENEVKSGPNPETRLPNPENVSHPEPLTSLKTGQAALAIGRRQGKQRLPSAEVGSSAPNPEPRTPNPELRLRANKQATPQNAFTELMATKQLGFWILLAAAAIAAGLGALHALEPGHGKTIVAAYLVGSQGTASHAVLLGLIVTASHTAGVYLLGAVTLYASRYVVPERLYPWLGVISGLTIAGLGLFLFLRRYAGDHHIHPHSHSHEDPHSHAHSHHEGHSHHHDHTRHSHGADEEHSHTHGTHLHRSHEGAGTVSPRQLLALGVTGGIVPCPAALVVLLSAISLHRVGFGLFLIVAFSVGLAAVLIAIGLLVVYAGHFMSRLQGGEGPLITRWLPLTSAAVITLLGVSIAVQALVTAGILQIRI